MRILGYLLLFSSLAISAEPGYHVIRKIPVGGEGGWDYLTVDSAARRLYVSHATHVVVVDLDAGKVAGDIPDTPGVHGIAIAPELGRGFISNGRGNNVSVFDLKTLKVIRKVPAGRNPDSILYDPVSGKVFTFNGASKDSTVIDAKTGQVEAVIPLGGKPEFSVSDGKGLIYVNIEDTHEIVRIDSRKNKVTRRTPLDQCEEPSGLAIDPAHGRLFSVCANKVMAVVDAAGGRVIAMPPIGEDTDGAGFDSGFAFSSNGEGTLTVVGGDLKAAGTVKTQPGARTMAIDPRTHLLYLPAAEFKPQPEGAKQRPQALPGSFTILVVGR